MNECFLRQVCIRSAEVCAENWKNIFWAKLNAARAINILDSLFSISYRLFGLCLKITSSISMYKAENGTTIDVK